MWTPSAPAATDGQCHGRDQIGPAGGVARIDDDRQMALPLDVRHGAMSSMLRVESSKERTPRSHRTTFGLPSRQDVLRRHQQVLDRRAHAALQQHRLPGLADFLEQVEVLHVAGADLEHVGIALDERNLPRVHHLGDDRHVVLVADVAQDLQPVLAEPLEAVRAGARLERAAAEDVRARPS